ncbi:carotene isomerase [Poseidonibacter parvus]|uniref:Carotene isomerase n=1 Tax=Poseidonibacter parvus TaxID=1850254 RepID=A0A1P8KJ76_9BACT|nr:NAD(P)-binding protein [Poseidonibacter parvus]APW64603.1 carotene isomerase [Poseidonibacter parvus]
MSTDIKDIAVVGSGIGGALISALNKDKDLILFEKDINLGGCASTFKKKGNYFNAGATTFVGYEDNHPIKNIFDKASFVPDIKKSEIAIRIIQNGKTLDRVKDFEEFLENLNEIYPHKNNRIFWTKIRDLDARFWQFKDLYFAKHSLSSYIKTISSNLKLFSIFGFDILKSADSFIDETLNDITKEYKDFINSQLLITLQTTSNEVSLISLALGLSYPFHDVFYANGGMGAIFDGLLKDIDVHSKEEILNIKKEKDFFRIISNKNEYKSKKVILNSTAYDSSILFDDEQIKKYYNSFSFSDQSAFVIYMSLKKENIKEELLHHYQIILDENIPNSISNSFFISISSLDDKKMSSDSYSITISTHTKALYWKNLLQEDYEKQKTLTQEFIVNEFLKNFTSIKKEDIKNCVSATSKTFKRYINRYNCGGKAITIKNILQTPSCNTPFENLHNVGDTIFAGQGWPGIALGVEILNKELND